MSTHPKHDSVAHPSLVMAYMLRSGPVPCADVSKRMKGLGIVGGLQARARERLGVTVIRDATGTPHYALPKDAQAA